MADSRPEPGPFTLTSISFSPNLVALSAAVSAARWAAKGVLLRLPLKPTVPAEAKHNTSPFVSVIVTIVLLKVAVTWAIPRLTLRRCFRFLLLAMVVISSIPRRASKGCCPADVGVVLSYPRISLTPFLPATVLRGPLRVLALVRVR